MDRDAHRELARAGGKATHAHRLAYRFTSEKTRAAGKAGGAETSANREHMVETGRKGGFSKRGISQRTGAFSGYPAVGPSVGFSVRSSVA